MIEPIRDSEETKEEFLTDDEIQKVILSRLYGGEEGIVSEEEITKIVNWFVKVKLYYEAYITILRGDVVLDGYNEDTNEATLSVNLARVDEVKKIFKEVFPDG